MEHVWLQVNNNEDIQEHSLVYRVLQDLQYHETLLLKACIHQVQQAKIAA